MKKIITTLAIVTSFNTFAVDVNNAAISDGINNEALRSFTFEDGWDLNKEQICKGSPCISLDETINFARKNNFETRIDALRVFQARKDVKVKMGMLLPSFNLRLSVFTTDLIKGFPLNMLEYVPNLLGFLFPSNWFHLAESKYYAKASEQSFYSLMANQINSSENLYYNIHQQTIDLNIQKLHREFVANLVALMQLKYQQGLVSLDEVRKAELYLREINVSYIQTKAAIGDMTPIMGAALDLPVAYNKFQLKRLPLINLTDRPMTEPNLYLDRIIAKSYELKSLEHLATAAKYSKRARYFEFLSPSSGTDSAFGFGYLSSINIGRAEQEIVKIQQEQMDAKLHESLYQIVAMYNSSLELFEEANKALIATDYVINANLQLLFLDSNVDFYKFREILIQHVNFQYVKNMAIHAYWIAKSNLRRLLVEGPYYKDLELLLPKKKGKLKCYQKKENRKLRKAFEEGEITIDPKFTDEEVKFCLSLR